MAYRSLLKPLTYRGFADAALLPFVREGWDQIVMANPAFWGACLFVGETIMGSPHASPEPEPSPAG